MMYQSLEKPFREISQLSAKDIAYQTEDPGLRKFYQHKPHLASFTSAIEAHKDRKTDRKTLHQELTKQYANLPGKEIAMKNVDALLQDNSYTIITAHQPSLLTGPLYFIYKICSALSLAKTLNREMDDVHIVPVFVTGGEDHDFDEICSVKIFGKTIQWQSSQTGAVGRMSTDDLAPVIDEVQEILGGGEHALELGTLIKQSLNDCVNYGDFMLRFVHGLFGSHGLVIANMDNRAFKESFLPLVEQDITEFASHKFVNQDQIALRESGYKIQAHAREVNLFYHGQNRDRVMHEEGDRFVINDHVYTLPEVKELFQNNPEKVSPNVILRPLYQEHIFPNLAYIGGGGEIAYWLERKSLFDYFKIPYPILIRRDSFLIIDAKSQKALDNMELKIDDLFEREETIINNFAKKQSVIEIDLSGDMKQMEEIFNRVAQKAKEVDPTLYKSVLGEGTKAQKILEYLESKILKAEKRKRSVELDKIARLKSRFFPGNDGLQERHDNFIPYYLKYGSKWIDSIIEHADPLNKNFKILIEKN